MQTLTGLGRDGAILRSVSRLLTATSLLLTRQLWIWPLIAALVLGVVGVWLRGTIEGVMKAQMADVLRAVRDADVKALLLQFEAHKALALIAADEPEVWSLVREIAANRETAVDPADLLRSPKLAELRSALKPWMERYEYDGFVVFNPEGTIVAATRDTLIGKQYPKEDAEFVATALAGKATVSRPFPSRAALVDLDGKERVGIPTMLVVAPIRGGDGRVVAALGLRVRPERIFTQILNVARFGAASETYAFDRSGRLLSQSRFDDDLKRIGLLADQPHIRSVLNLELRDPQVDMTTGARPVLRRGDQPLTRMAAEAVGEKKPGVDVAGYRDYRGVPVVGAWTWLPEYGFGVATEVDRAEAYRPLTILRRAFGTLFALLAAAAVAIFVFTVLVARLQRSMQKAVLAARQLGRYTLDEKIGAGGMGVVYRAHHAMLRRPIAIKLLHVEKTNDVTIARFEREVQLTSQLNHPNTITIYDYGRTAEGLFYYAMEYLDGFDLQDLIDRFGPQPEGRVIHILGQVCGSLAEAHGVGLIHRDIKLANIILNRRGGVCDVVKLVDFGLVKAADAGREASLTASGTITGTPLYMAPESITSPDRVDARSDLYSVGAVGYALLTGRPIFDGQSVPELLFQQVNTPAEPPSSLGNPVSPDLESLLLRCLAKRPEGRPASAAALIQELACCASAGTWTASDAEIWWQDHASGGPPELHPDSLDTRSGLTTLLAHPDRFSTELPSGPLV